MSFIKKLEICCNCFSVLFILSCFSIFPIVQIIQGTYFDSMNCTVNILPMNYWLIIIGSSEILQVFLSIINIMVKKYMLFYLINLLYLFNISWLIVGCIIFFRDCNNLSVSDNALLYCSFVYGYILVCSIARQNFKNINEIEFEKKDLYIVI
jgi:hypothetical protein